MIFGLIQVLPLKDSCFHTEFRKIFALPFTSELFPESDLDSLSAMCYWVPILLNHHGIFIGFSLPAKWGLLRKPNRLQRNLSQRSRGVKLATNRAIVGCCNC